VIWWPLISGWPTAWASWPGHVGYFLLRASLNPPGGRLISLQVGANHPLVAITASLTAG